MITGLEIENFRCFGKRVHVPLAPITVLVGPNNAGKTTIIRLLAALQQTYESSPSQPFCALLPKGTNLGPIERVFYRCRSSEGATLGFRFSPEEGRPAFSLRIRLEASERKGIPMVVPRSFEFDTAADGSVVLDIECPDPPESAGKKTISNGDESCEVPLYRAVCRECSSEPALWREAFERLRSRAEQEQKREDEEEERRSRASRDGGGRLSLYVERLHPDFRHWLLREATLESFAERMAGEVRGDQIVESNEAFLPPTFEGNSHDGLMPNQYCLAACYELRTFFSQLDTYSPFRRAGARNITVDSPVASGSWEDGSFAMSRLALDPSLRSEVNRWLDLLTGVTLPDPTSSGGLRINLCDPNAGSDTPLDLADLGYGITHLLPILTQLLGSGNKIAMIMQPETHVHPSLQARIGEMFAHVWNIHKTRSIVETHSEYIIRRLQRRVRGGTLAPADVAILYVDRHPEGSTVTHLRMDASGDFIDPWPHGFFADGLKEVLGD